MCISARAVTSSANSKQFLHFLPMNQLPVRDLSGHDAAAEKMRHFGAAVVDVCTRNDKQGSATC